MKTQIDSIVSMGNTGTAIFAIYITIAVGVEADAAAKVGLIIILLLLMVGIYLLVLIVKRSLERYAIWNEYINIAIEEVEKELKDKVVK